jgi:phytoene dehydrogenase-like protein
MRSSVDADVIIVGAGIAGLSCARQLMKENISFLLLEAGGKIGGRLKTENVDGFRLNYGFQVLQTAYPEAQRMLDFDRLALKPFAPGMMIRIGSKFYRISDPSRRFKDFFSTLIAPIGTLMDRIRILRLARLVSRSKVSDIFNAPEMPTIDFLRKQGFSEKIIQRFFKPFFAGICLDADIRASSRVFCYIFRVFAKGDVTLPAEGMVAIAQQLAQSLAPEKIRTSARVKSVSTGEVVLDSGEKLSGRAVVIATEGPETARLCQSPTPVGSRGELCIYFSAKTVPITEAYLVLNAEPNKMINNLTVPSRVIPSYSPPGMELISVVVLGNPSVDDAMVEKQVRQELMEWFGPIVGDWRHLRTQRIMHALPDQSPPIPNPEESTEPCMPGVYICGEYNSVPGIQWALLSGRQAAEQVIRNLGMHH